MSGYTSSTLNHFQRNNNNRDNSEYSINIHSLDGIFMFVFFDNMVDLHKDFLKNILVREYL